MNGWQRLWVLVNLLLLPLFLFIAYSLQPNDYDTNNEKKGRIIEFVVKNDPALSEFKPWELAARYADLAPERFLELFTQRYGTEHPEFKNSIEGISKKIDDERTHRIQLLYAKVLAAWAIAAVALYVLGFSVGWVYRGFKKRE